MTEKDWVCSLLWRSGDITGGTTAGQTEFKIGKLSEQNRLKYGLVDKTVGLCFL